MFRILKIAALGLILLLSFSCKKDDEVVVPKRNWRLTYTVQALSDISIKEISYVDELGALTTVPGERDFSVSFDAETGFIARLVVVAEAINGGVIGSIDLQALDGSLDQEFVSKDDGHSGTTPKDIILELEFVLP